MAASKIDEGTDVNYGELTRKMAQHLQETDNVEVNIIMKWLILHVYQMVNGQ